LCVTPVKGCDKKSVHSYEDAMPWKEQRRLLLRLQEMEHEDEHGDSLYAPVLQNGGGPSSRGLAVCPVLVERLPKV